MASGSVRSICFGLTLVAIFGLVLGNVVDKGNHVEEMDKTEVDGKRINHPRTPIANAADKRSLHNEEANGDGEQQSAATRFLASPLPLPAIYEEEVPFDYGAIDGEKDKRVPRNPYSWMNFADKRAPGPRNPYSWMADEAKRTPRNPYSWMVKEKRSRNPYSWMADEEPMSLSSNRRPLASSNHPAAYKRYGVSGFYLPPFRYAGTELLVKRGGSPRNPYSWMNE